MTWSARIRLWFQKRRERKAIEVLESLGYVVTYGHQIISPYTECTRVLHTIQVVESTIRVDETELCRTPCLTSYLERIQRELRHNIGSEAAKYAVVREIREGFCVRYTARLYVVTKGAKAEETK